MAIEFADGVYTQTGNLHMPSGLQTFIPEVWSAELIVELEAGLVLSSARVTNRRYEGNFQREGDTVRLPHVLSTVTIRDGGDAYAAIGEADRAELESLIMRIDSGKTWHFEVDSLHQLRTKAGIDLMASLVQDAGKKLADEIDNHVALTIKDAITAKDRNNAGQALHGSVKALPTPADLYETVVDMRTELDMNNVPQDGRYIIVGPKEYAVLLKDPRFIDKSAYGGSSVIINGEVGRLVGMPVIVSNTVGSHLPDVATSPKKRYVKKPHTGATGIHVVVGHQMAVSFAGQLTEIESFRPEQKFTNAVKGRYIYGCKVIRPEAMVVSGPVGDAGGAAASTASVKKASK